LGGGQLLPVSWKPVLPIKEASKHAMRVDSLLSYVSKNWTAWLILLVSFAVESATVAATPILVDQSSPKYLGHQGEYLFDATGQRTIDDIARHGDFAPPLNSMANYGFKAGTGWARLNFVNPHGQPIKRMLNYRFPITDRVTLYVRNAAGRFVSATQGDMVSFSQHSRDYRSPAFQLTLPPGRSTVYLKVDTSDILKWPLFLWTEDSFTKFKTQEYFIIALTLGIIIFVVIASIIFYSTLKDRTFLHIALYNVFFIVFEISYLGLLDQLFHLDPVWLEYGDQWMIINGLLSCVFVTNFTVRFLQSGLSSREFMVLAKSFVGLMLASVLISLIGGNHAGAILLVVSNLLMLVTIVLGGVQAMKNDYAPAKLYFLAWSFMVVGNLLFMANFVGLFPQQMYLEFGIMFGVVFKEALLCWVLGRLKLHQDRKTRDQQVKTDQIHKSLKLARSVQESLIPPIEPMAGLEFFTFYQPAETIGGDWYGVYNFPERQVSLVLLGDVTGHGIPSALLSSSVASVAEAVVQPMIGQAEDYNRFLEELFLTFNRTVIQRSVDKRQLMTMVALLVDLNAQKVHYINAGHTGVIVKASSRTRSLLVSGTPLGFSQRPRFGHTEIPIADVRSLVAYSDGLIENFRTESKPLKEREVTKFVAMEESAGETFKMICNRFQAQYETSQQPDDCTLIMIDVREISHMGERDSDLAG
jgi:serine phosphatase RsbU (regulator of sigma subunit)